MPNKQKTILIVEDNELNLKLFTDLLTGNGFKVESTTDGQKALGLIKKILPNLIIMDIQLHNISGCDIIKDVKSDSQLTHIPIIAVTAFAMKDDKERILSSGCDAYIAKPISIVPFINTIKEFINK